MKSEKNRTEHDLARSRVSWRAVSTGRFFQLATFLLLLFAAIGCKPDPDVIYEVNDVQVVRPTGAKGSQKSLTEFISIAYADIFEQNITQSDLIALSLPYQSFGDLKYIEDLIIRNFLNEPDALVPSETEMRANVEVFVTATYQRFFNRTPSEFEVWYVKNLIDDNPDITPEMVYYSIMTSDEYRYY